MSTPALSRSHPRQAAGARSRRRAPRAELCEVVAQRRPMLLAVALRILHDADEAEDAVQDGLVSAWRGLASFRGQAALSTWLHAIVVRAALMRLRRLRRRGRLQQGAADLPIGGASDPERESAARAEVALALRGLRGLPPGARALLLARAAGRDPSELARELGVSRAGLKTRVHRARLALRAALAEPR